MESHDGRTLDWVLELHSIDSLDEPTLPATPTSNSIELPRWSTEITPGEGSPRTRAAQLASSSHPVTTRPEPLPGAPDCLEFIKKRRWRGIGAGGAGGWRFQPARQTRLRNSLLAAVGFLELANAGDFAANVWNQTPVPLYVLVLMAIGGTAALGMIYFCICDGLLSWQNLCALAEERRYLQGQRMAYRQLDHVPQDQQHHQQRDEELAELGDHNMQRTIDCFLDMNTREMGTEMVDRLGMDTLLGFSAFFVSLGTFMAMDGGQHRGLYMTSNLLTGYVGNTPCSIFGVINVIWSCYVWQRARKQQRAALNYVKSNSTRLGQMLRNRTSSIQMHAALTGVTCFVSGGAALVTATMWWGYVVLVPCVVTSGLANLFWRRRVGYERPLVAHRIMSIDQDTVVEALRYADACRRRVLYGRQTDAKDPYTTLVSETNSLSCALDIIRKNNLFEDFCIRLLEGGGGAGDEDISSQLNTVVTVHPLTENNSISSVTIDWHQLVAVEDETLKRRLLEVAKEMINESILQSFIYQERHILEVLGCFMCRGAEFGRRKKGKRTSYAGVQKQAQRNVHTYAGRHANDWLFGGFSLTQSIKYIFRR